MQNSRPILLNKIISGGQTGADRAALDFALRHRIPHGGWCPKGRLAEDGPIPERYSLIETPSEDSIQRTEWNVRESDGTLILSLRPELSGGSLRTLELARAYKHPVAHISKSSAQIPLECAVRFLAENQIRCVNIAGPRESEEPGIGAWVGEVLEQIFAPCRWPL